ncbi:hypothetical protein BSU04_25900 [Caballeronia sordidicola]|uniref:Uncharacterized protein n=2 Tax=Caballeronia sordidicola TaxID=196367 RepID=A0A226WY07_CABSO|nr:hypothetical protein BSU04_25900 [Caballeronia sordidicola]
MTSPNNALGRAGATSANRKPIESRSKDPRMNASFEMRPEGARLWPAPRAFFVAALASLSLAACGGSPSESDVRAALSKQVDAGLEQARQIAGKNAFFDRQAAERHEEVQAMKLIGCKSDGEKAYLCDVEGKGGAGQIRMLKGSDGWLASDPKS